MIENKIVDFDNLVLEGKLITIHPLTMQHENSLGKQFSQDLFEFSPLSNKDNQEFFENALKLKEQGNFFPWIFLENKTKNCIGTSSFSSIDMKNKKCEIGWTWFGKYFQKNGYNVESKLLLLEYLFEKENFNRVEFKTDELNIKSNLAMQKLGFVKEGKFRNHFIMPSGRIRHSIYYSVIKEEWPDTKKLILNRLNEKMRQ
jgi:RimJ/RimL family protein N-acetyltransferase